MDIHELGKDLQFVGSQLVTIRNLSKGKAIDYNQPPYNSDIRLLQHLLDKEIMNSMPERSDNHQKGRDSDDTNKNA